ncbi:MAG: phosphatidate cytidylyltransferase [Zetaproteobacteria bacterium CG06_land_8_20_14_3_00_59_53]|nr:MAG: hypothetical protein AUK36_05030 [Zetaproteobacteria bacterium CG2_30_59_37]PIO90432.1 MAG: phosphatidate cytidylyltransferase [Zetaproteobacteria bacterium CG23_combo_of_CG06-09_8_20_14_all_59_86]PIU71383.1 MAG: phosphatidate cytidylyltransferase [Zetaproteobacteria bacterium CG06_land_8_20_14_3_00_59_53]PIU97639.1 MAG: phosphatidate cytidylyltransferase [Zetaproteobacteria bacterium CG03_land_8_20_14_0_80_59_51]PIY47211.1 MAG: phosphatidate cytidylyltransferase [Zetaproteobacteria bac
MSELLKRILTASILAPLAVWWLLFAPSPWFEVLLGMLGLAAMFELIVMLALPGRIAYVFSGAAGIALLIVSQQVAAVILLLSVLWLGVFMLAVRRESAMPVAEQTHRFALGCWMTVWLLLFVWVTGVLHHLPSGHLFMLGAFVGVWAADIGAYFAGRAFGKNKLCLPISPGKSVEGAIAGAVCGILASGSIWTSYTDLAMLPAMLIGLALVITAVLGDLGESAIKRAVGVKDSGRMLPGHGGLLDRVDALLPAVAVAGVLYLFAGGALGISRVAL